jgi:AcrR family transcriptional regulator
MPRARSLTLPALTEAALRVIDRAGLSGLSMRTVADELGIGTMSLYRYVAGREQLEGLVVEHVAGSIDLALPPRLHWDKRIATLLLRLREALARHPAIIPLLVSRRHIERSSLRLAEALLEALTEAGITGKRRVIALRALLSYSVGALQFQALAPLSGGGTDAMAALPHDQFPLLAETARAARRVTPHEEFQRGLELLLRGLRDSAAQSG